MKINDKYKGICYIILAAFGFAFMNLFVKLAGDLPAIEKSFFRNLVAIFFAFIVMKKEKISFVIPQGSKKYIFFRSLFSLAFCPIPLSFSFSLSANLIFFLDIPILSCYNNTVF